MPKVARNRNVESARFFLPFAVMMTLTPVFFDRRILIGGSGARKLFLHESAFPIYDALDYRF